MPAPDALPSDVADLLAELADQLACFRFRLDSEDSLQRGIQSALSGYGAVRERVIEEGRVDVWVPTRGGRGVAVEAKVKGSVAALTRQVARYAEDAAVEGVLVVSSRALHVPPDLLNGKPCRTHLLISQGLL